MTGRNRHRTAGGLALPGLLLASIAATGGCAMDETETNTPGPDPEDEGEVIRGSHGTGDEARSYRLFVPDDLEPGAPLVVILHGCTQDAADVATGTRMDARAHRRGFLALYPEQRRDAHPQGCWRWFDPDHQRRDAGEPGVLSGMIREVMREREADPDRVYVAGISAGGAMAVVLGVRYPDLVAGVGVHSGMPFATAADVREAEAALGGGGPGVAELTERLREGLGTGRVPPPLIVFQGRDDPLVHPENARRIVESWLHVAREAAAAEATGRGDHRAEVPEPTLEEEGVSEGGLSWARRAWDRETAGTPVEWWTVEGLGHAWSGGHEEGTFTDPRGPDASRAMLDFFVTGGIAFGSESGDRRIERGP